MTEITNKRILAKKRLETTNIRHFKLSSGDEIISLVLDLTPDDTDDKENIDLVDSEEEYGVLLDTPLKMNIITNNSGQTFFLSKWNPISKTSFCFVNPNHIIAHSECTNLLKERYVSVVMEMFQSSNDDNEPVPFVHDLIDAIMDTDDDDDDDGLQLMDGADDDTEEQQQQQHEHDTQQQQQTLDEFEDEVDTLFAKNRNRARILH